MNPHTLARIAPLALGGLALGGLVIAAAPTLLVPEDDTVEPPARFVVSVDGDSHEVTAGETLEVVIDGKKHKLTVAETESRVLNAAGVQFEYPRSMSFEYESEFGVKIWTLDGNDATAMIFEFALGMGLDEFVADQAEAYESLGEVTLSTAELELDGKVTKGGRITVVADAFGLTVDVLPLEGDDECRRWILLQDTVEPGEPASEELVDLKESLTETLTWKR